MSINLISYYDDEGRARYPLYISRRNSPTEIDLLYFDGHYAWIKNFSRLFSDLTKHKRQKFFCKRCLNHFYTPEVLARHQQLCTRDDYSSVIHIMPEPGTELEFTNWKYGTWAPFVIYADLESVLAPNDQQRGATHLYQKHKPCAASALLCSKIRAFDGRFCLFTGEDAVKQLLDKLVEWERECIDHLQQNRAMVPLRGRKLEQHVNATECCICHRANRPFVDGDPDFRKVADHDHVTGYYRGAAHDLCNRKRRVVYDIPVFLHNFRGYDSHLIVRALTCYPNRQILPIAQNIERYLQVKWGENLVFRDSLQFLSASLESLVESLRKTDESLFTRLQSVIGSTIPERGLQAAATEGCLPIRVPRLVRKDERRPAAATRGLPQLSDRKGLLGGRLPVRAAGLDRVRLPLARGLPQALPHERRGTTRGRVPKLPRDLLSLSIPAGSCLLRLGSAARLELNVQNVGSQARAHLGFRDVSHDPAEHPRWYLPRERPLCPCEQQVHGLALRPDKAQLVHPVHRRDEPVRMGNVATAAVEVFPVAERSGSA